MIFLRKNYSVTQLKRNFAAMNETTLYIALLAAGASFVQRTTGFGFGIFIMSALPYLMPSYGEATTLSGILALTTSTIIVLNMRKYIVWKRLAGILMTFVAISAIAICMLSKIEGRTMRMILGAVLILTSLYFSFFKDKVRKFIRPDLRSQIGAGTLSGVMGGLFGMQGPPAVLYFISTEPDKNHYMAIIQMYFVIGNTMMTIVRALNGYLTPAVGTTYIYSLAGLAVGTLAGSWAFSRIPNRIFTYVVYAYIGISGAIILLTA